MEKEMQRFWVLGIMQPSYYMPFLNHFLKGLRKVSFMKKVRSTMIKVLKCLLAGIFGVALITNFHRPSGLIETYFLPLLSDHVVLV